MYSSYGKELRLTFTIIEQVVLVEQSSLIEYELKKSVLLGMFKPST